MSGIQKDVVGILSATLGIVVLIVLVSNSGGVARILESFIGGWTGLVATLADRSPRRV